LDELLLYMLSHNARIDVAIAEDQDLVDLLEVCLQHTCVVISNYDSFFVLGHKCLQRQGTTESNRKTTARKVLTLSR
jgi:hypothetical protein